MVTQQGGGSVRSHGVGKRETPRGFTLPGSVLSAGMQAQVRRMEDLGLRVRTIYFTEAQRLVALPLT